MKFYKGANTLFAWTVELHNQVNQLLGKSMVTMEEAKAFWMKVAENRYPPFREDRPKENGISKIIWIENYYYFNWNYCFYLFTKDSKTAIIFNMERHRLQNSQLVQLLLGQVTSIGVGPGILGVASMLVGASGGGIAPPTSVGASSKNFSMAGASFSPSFFATFSSTICLATLLAASCST